MQREYVVCDWEGNISCDDAGEPEIFKKFRGVGGAEERARSLAETTPGHLIRIYELTAEAIAPVAGPEVSRAHPTEHYK